MKKPQMRPGKAAPEDATPKPQPPPAFGGGRQAGQIDFSVVKELAEPYIVEILEQLAPDGELRGNQYMMYNPHRVDNNLGSFSFSIENHKWKDFGHIDDEVKGGDIISLAAYLWRVNQTEAARRISDLVEDICTEDSDASPKIKATNKSKQASKTEKGPGIAVVPVPDDAAEPLSLHFGLRSTARYVYTDEHGNIVCFVNRFDPKDKRKYFLPQTYRQMSDGSLSWKWKGLDSARPLYNLYELSQRPEAEVVIVEGEKAADAARALFPNHVVVTTMQGSQSPNESDLGPLKGRSIIIWPDNDKAGEGYVKKLSELLFAQDPTAHISVLSVPDVSPEMVEGKASLKPGFVAPKGWDAADAVEEGWTAEHVARLLVQPGTVMHLGNAISTVRSNSPETNVVFNMPDHVSDYLRQTFGDNLLYTNGSFFAYTRGRWQKLNDLADVKNSIARYYGKNATPTAIDAMFSLLQAFRAVTDANFAPDRRMICMQNGTLNTDTYQLEEHSPDHGLVNALDIAWDSKAACPRWVQFLNEIFIDDADKLQKIAFLQQWFGYCLTPDMDQHKFVWMVGAGGNGKSVLLTILEALVGRDNVGHAQLERFESKVVRAELEGKLLNVSSEMSATATVSDSYLKQIVGGDAIEAERKFKDPYTFQPTVKLIAATNQLPRLLDMSDGFARRAVIITFNRKFTEAEMDPKLVTKLKSELPGILVWAIEGLEAMRSNGKFAIPESSKIELDAYRKESDPVASFIAECVTPNMQKGLSPKRVYEIYQAWSRDSGFMALNKINFGRRLVVHGIEKGRSAGKDYWMVNVEPPDSYIDPTAKIATEDITSGGKFASGLKYKL